MQRSRPSPAAPGPEWLAERILETFEDYQARFRGLARRSKRLFEARDWWTAQAAARERLVIYRLRLDRVVEEVHERLGDRARSPRVWSAAKTRYARISAPRDDAEIGRTFFNSVSRRVLGTVGVRAEAEFLGEETGPVVDGAGGPVAPPAGAVSRGPGHEAAGPAGIRAYRSPRPTPELMRRVLTDMGLATPYRDLEGDARVAADAIAAELRRRSGDDRIEALEIVSSLFYRNKGAYLVGRVRCGAGLVPLILPLLNGDDGVFVDAVLMTADEASNVFGFSWSYFHVDVPRPARLVGFLGSIIPHKRVDELYTSIGYNRHGKTLLYQSLREHLAQSGARFEPAEGTPGTVMSVFTLPSLDVVFKVIRSRFAPPKWISPRVVRAGYRLVFYRDRVGRLADVQAFEHLSFRVDQFSPRVLDELLGTAPRTVSVDGEAVVIEHLYTQRRVYPLDLYLKHAQERGEPDVALAALLDYGQAVKDLAAARTFPGDLLLKNFGVTRHGRVIFYDYDELSLLTGCVFREIPEAVFPEDELADEPWFHVGERDLFPEEFHRFLAVPPALRSRFMAAHGDLFEAAFWRRMQERARAEEVVDFYPYPRFRRMRRAGEPD